MAESSLSMTLSDLQEETGRFLGWGGDSTTWTADQAGRITSCVKSGLRQFYFPPPLDGEASAHEWTFLRPASSLGLPTDSQSIPLPDDFGGLEGSITVTSSGSNTVGAPVRVYNPGQVREAYALIPSATGRPEMAAVEWLKGTTGTQGQRAELLVYPQADQDYTLTFTYYVLADYLSGAFPYAYGGVQHAETILESCLAIAEERLDDSSSIHRLAFERRLAASISADRKSRPQTLGYNGDRSDRMFPGRSPYWQSTVLWNGVQP